MKVDNQKDFDLISDIKSMKFDIMMKYNSMLI